MKKSSLFYILSLVVVLSMVLAACQPAATPTAPAAAEPTATTAAAEEPTATEAAAEPTEAATAEATSAATEAAAPSGDFTGLKTEAPDCSYGGEFKSIEAVDASTVKFTLCNPDPAFLSKVAFDVFGIAKKAELDKQGGDSVKMSDEAIGTGPFTLDNWARGDSVTFKANPDYCTGAANLPSTP